MAASGALPLPRAGAGARSTPRPCGGFGAHAAPSVRRAGPDLEGRGGRPAAGGAVHGHAGAGAGAAGGAWPAGACRGEPRDCQLRTGTWPGRRPGAPLPTRSRGHLPAPEPQFPVGTSCWAGHCLDELERLGEPKLVGVLGSRSLPTRPPTGPGDSRGQRGQGLGAHAQQQGELRGPALPVRCAWAQLRETPQASHRCHGEAGIHLRQGPARRAPAEREAGGQAGGRPLSLPRTHAALPGQHHASAPAFLPPALVTSWDPDAVSLLMLEVLACPGPGCVPARGTGQVLHRW